MDDDYYLIDSAETTSRSASMQETRTMLYMMGQMSGSKDIGTFVIDVVNDVVSANIDNTVFYDAQSKGEKESSPKSIGTDLVTLYKDYLSILDYDCYILSLRKISNNNLNVLIEKPIQMLRYSDFTITAQKQIRDALLDECLAKDYIHKRYSDYLSQIDAFLDEVVILINDDSSDSYIKNIAFINNGAVSTNELSSIFEDIREKQLAIKTSCDVNRLKLYCLTDQLKLGRNLKVEVINSLVLERITGMAIINENRTKCYIPLKFTNYLVSLNLDQDEQTEFIEGLVHEMYKAFCNTNLNKEFWDLIFAISSLCRANKTASIIDIYNNLLMNYGSLLYTKCLSESGLLYLIANVMEGLI